MNWNSFPIPRIHFVNMATRLKYHGCPRCAELFDHRTLAAHDAIGEQAIVARLVHCFKMYLDEVEFAVNDATEYPEEDVLVRLVGCIELLWDVENHFIELLSLSNDRVALCERIYGKTNGHPVINTCFNEDTTPSALFSRTHEAAERLGRCNGRMEKEDLGEILLFAFQLKVSIGMFRENQQGYRTEHGCK